MVYIPLKDIALRSIILSPQMDHLVSILLAKCFTIKMNTISRITNNLKTQMGIQIY